MSNKLEYRAITPEDYQKLTDIMTLAFNEDTAMHTDLKEDGPNGYNDGSMIRRLNEQKGLESFKILYEDETVGAYTVRPMPEQEYILELLFLSPDCRKEHLGTAVWHDIEQKYRDAKKWTLETPAYSKRNHHFYSAKCGFSFVCERPCGNGASTYVFEKIL